MKYNLYLLNFNNYYNRQVRKMSSIQDYIDGGYLINTLQDCNFEFRDGINSELTINYAYVDQEPDYILVEDKTDNHFTRWFVVDSELTRGGQYRFTIRRDVIAEYFDTIRNSDCLVKKGYVDNNSILAFNREDQQYNKIKTSEKLLKDKVDSGYVIGFIERESPNADKVIKTTYFDDRPVDFDYDSLPSSIKNYMGIGSANPTSKLKVLKDDALTNVGVELDFATQWSITGINVDAYRYSGYVFSNPGNYRGKHYFNIPGSVGDVDNNWCGLDQTGYTGNPPAITTAVAVNQGLATTYNTSALKSSTGSFAEMYSNKWHERLNGLSKSFWWEILPTTTGNYSTYQTLMAYDGKYCQINGNYYKCRVVRNNSTQHQRINGLDLPLSFQYGSQMIKGCLPTDEDMSSMQTSASYYEVPKYFTGKSGADATSKDFYLYYFDEDLYIQLVQENIQVWTTLKGQSDRSHLVDAPYDMFLIPYSDTLKYVYNSVEYTANKNLAINLAIEMGRQSGTSALWDIQIVPFSAIRSLIDNSSGGKLYLDNYDVVPIQKGSGTSPDDPIVGYYLWATTSSGTLQITETDPRLTLDDTEFTYKEITQLNEYILCSPAKDSTYEFNPAMNRGIHKWNVSYNYRPYSSYIKIQPEWDYLYGNPTYNDLTDMRGLIFNGNYSITQLSNAWAEYSNANKNYQQIFDKQVNTQIKKYDLNEKVRTKTLGLRSYSLNPIKSVMNVIGESKQMDFDREMFNVDMQAQRELFGYQLDNIKSQPDGISKLTSLNIDFRIYPYVEIYEPTAEDLTFFRNNSRWNGMTIMVVGKIGQFIKPGDETYVEATLLRFNEPIAESSDTHLVREINKELNTGIYINSILTAPIDYEIEESLNTNVQGE